MTAFAHIETGQALDPQVNDTAAQYLARYHGAVTQNWQIAQVPDGTQHGAHSDGHGGWINPPPPPAPPKKPVALTEADFIQLVQTVGGMTDAQLVACKADANFAALWIKFGAAPFLDRDDPRVQAGLAGLEAAGYIAKPGGAAAIAAAWPVQ